MEGMIEHEPLMPAAAFMAEKASEVKAINADAEKGLTIQHDISQASSASVESSDGSSSSEVEIVQPASAWSLASVVVFIFGNIIFALYCVFGIPRIQGKQPWIVYGLAAYISMLGIMQLVEGIATGSGTNYGKFGGVADKDVQKGFYQRLMDMLARPTVPISISWWTMEQPSFIVPLIFSSLFISTSGAVSAGCVYLGLFMLHYAQRSFVYPILTRGKPYPCLYWFLALVFTSCNVIGAIIFLFGMYTNIRCDNILRNLRKPGETGYKIPRGFMFEYISGANLWGEVVEWTGFAIATRGLGAIVFAVFCWIGIGSRCYATHTWYLKKFGDSYPKQRKHLIPFLW